MLLHLFSSSHCLHLVVTFPDVEGKWTYCTVSSRHESTSWEGTAPTPRFKTREWPGVLESGGCQQWLLSSKASYYIIGILTELTELIHQMWTHSSVCAVCLQPATIQHTHTDKQAIFTQTTIAKLYFIKKSLVPHCSSFSVSSSHQFVLLTIFQLNLHFPGFC